MFHFVMTQLLHFFFSAQYSKLFLHLAFTESYRAAKASTYMGDLQGKIPPSYGLPHRDASLVQGHLGSSQKENRWIIFYFYLSNYLDHYF